MYYVLKYYKYVLIGVSVLLLAAGSLAILGRFQRGGVKGLALEYRTFRGKWSMVPLILAVLLLNLFLIPAGERLHTSAGITLNYHLASQGLNPNGTRFNQTHILSTQVLERHGGGSEADPPGPTRRPGEQRLGGRLFHLLTVCAGIQRGPEYRWSGRGEAAHSGDPGVSKVVY